jgi:hypothetical protein
MNTFRRPKLNKAIRAINPDAEFTYNNDDVSTIKWCNDTAPIPAEDILAKLTELQAEYDALEYARKRKEEYPSIEECVHAILDDDLDNLQVLRQAVKDKYPKD